MAYETGTASNVEALLTALGVFASARGWTVHYSGNRSVAGANPGTALILSRNQAHVTFRAYASSSVTGAVADLVPYVLINGHNAYSAGGGTESQSNYSVSALANLMAGPFSAYHFFGNENPSGESYLHVVVEKSPGFFRHFGTGILNLFGVVNTGQYVYGTYWDPSSNTINRADSEDHGVPFDTTSFGSPYKNSVRADFDGVINRWATAQGSLGIFGSRSAFYTFASDQTQRAILWPFLYYVSRPNSQNSWLGSPPNVRAVSLEFLNAGETLNLGSDSWKVFPIVRRNGNLGEENSGTFGIAYKT